MYKIFPHILEIKKIHIKDAINGMSGVYRHGIIQFEKI